MTYAGESRSIQTAPRPQLRYRGRSQQALHVPLLTRAYHLLLHAHPQSGDVRLHVIPPQAWQTTSPVRPLIRCTGGLLLAKKRSGISQDGFPETCLLYRLEPCKFQGFVLLNHEYRVTGAQYASEGDVQNCRLCSCSGNPSDVSLDAQIFTNHHLRHVLGRTPSPA